MLALSFFLFDLGGTEMKEEKTKIKLKVIKMICGIFWAICCGVVGVIGGYISGTRAVPKLIRAKQIWDDLTEESEDDEWIEW